MMRTLSWLHFTDFHQGMQTQSHLWPGVREILVEDLKRLHERCGPWDMVLFTGDLTQQGSADEFARLDETLGSLWEVFGELGSSPYLLPVPGNHDLEWPDACPEATALKYWEHESAVQEELFDAGTSRYREFLEEAFANYSQWLARTELPKPATFAPGLLPGDFSATIEKSGFELGVVGLNSAFLQLGKGNYEGRLAVDVRQFHGSCGGDGPAWVRRHDCALLLTHHPPQWLSSAARAHLNAEIHIPGRFAAHLFGNMHEHALTSLAVGGTSPRRALQGHSLFGLEHWGDKQERKHGYSAGRITLANDGSATLRVWPRVGTRHLAGYWHLHSEADRFTLKDDGGTEPVVVKTLRTSKRAADPGSTQVKEPAGEWGEQKQHLLYLIEETSKLDIGGIESPAGTARERRLEDFYTPLYTHSGAREAFGPGERGIAGGGGLGMAGGSLVRLTELLRHESRVLVVGQPGSGKTTFTRLLACMHARDCLGGRDKPPGCETWREAYLHPGYQGPEYIPVRLLARTLVEHLNHEQGAPAQNLRDWLVHVMAFGRGRLRPHLPNPPFLEYPRNLVEWKQRCEAGKVLLIIDGLDEAGTDEDRQTAEAVIADAARWPGPIVATSRPVEDYAKLRAKGFTKHVISDFRRGDVETFVENWQRAAHELGSRKARSKATSLLRQIDANGELMRMAGKPVMLTCLCLTQFYSDSDLPEGRTEVYKIVFKALLTSRKELRKKKSPLPLHEERVAELMGQLAVAMMGEGGKLVTSLYLDDAAGILRDEFKRYYREDSNRQLKWHARAWIVSECEFSGVLVQEQGSVKFWHTTFQEYCAAQWLSELQRGEGTDPKEYLWARIQHEVVKPQWREVLRFLSGLLKDHGRDFLVEKILAYHKKPSKSQQGWAYAMVTKLAREAGGYRPSATLQQKIGELRLEVLPMFEKGSGVSVEVGVRIEVAEALGEVDDPRLGEGPEWLPVPGQSIKLAKYPVTVQAFRQFVKYGGYQKDGYWSAEGKKLRDKHGWQAPGGWERQTKHLNWPVFGVSWYEAEAYCAWLSKVRDEEIGLPTRAQWQAAVRPEGEKGDGWLPWGLLRKEYSGVEKEELREFVNFNYDVGHPTPVGVYPQGEGPHGHSDLAGNVWEWCADSVGEAEEKRLNKQHSDLKAKYGLEGRIHFLMGGSWWEENVRRLAAACRGRHWSVFRLDFRGFRVCLREP